MHRKEAQPVAVSQRHKQPEFREAGHWSEGVLVRSPLLVDAAQVGLKHSRQVPACGVFCCADARELKINRHRMPLSVASADPRMNGHLRQPIAKALTPPFRSGSINERRRPHKRTYSRLRGLKTLGAFQCPRRSS